MSAHSARMMEKQELISFQIVPRRGILTFDFIVSASHRLESRDVSVHSLRQAKHGTIISVVDLNRVWGFITTQQSTSVTKISTLHSPNRREGSLLFH